uniref:HMG box domain-containing protein n=1 Tax=Echeneis naucrates TaxID=173247 RepID=A0A665URD9_ECHNA
PPNPSSPLFLLFPPHHSNKRKREQQQDDDQEYVKKPLNAFMLYKKEQRNVAAAELNTNNSAVINTLLGQKWKSLPKEEQAKYYEQAAREQQLHAQMFPNCSCSDNYGKKRKRVRRKATTTAEGTIAFLLK